MKILLTGASSYVGARIYFDLKDKYNLTGTYHTNQLNSKFIQLNLTNKNKLEKTITEIKPEIIIHVANYPTGRNAINNEENFYLLNKITTDYIINEANTIGSKVIFISSLAAEHHNDIYGKLKLESEEIVKRTKKGYLILRPAFILGYSPNTKNDRPFNRILKCIDDRTKPAVFDTSWKLQPTYVGHLSQIIDNVIKKNYWNKLITAYINKIVTQYQIAKDILSRFNIPVSPIDKHMNISPSTDNLSEMKRFHLTPNTYKGFIETMIEEIKSRKRFVL